MINEKENRIQLIKGKKRKNKTNRKIKNGKNNEKENEDSRIDSCCYKKFHLFLRQLTSQVSQRLMAFAFAHTFLQP